MKSPLIAKPAALKPASDASPESVAQVDRLIAEQQQEHAAATALLKPAEDRLERALLRDGDDVVDEANQEIATVKRRIERAEARLRDLARRRADAADAESEARRITDYDEAVAKQAAAHKFLDRYPALCEELMAGLLLCKTADTLRERVNKNLPKDREPLPFVEAKHRHLPGTPDRVEMVMVKRREETGHDLHLAVGQESNMKLVPEQRTIPGARPYQPRALYDSPIRLPGLRRGDPDYQIPGAPAPGLFLGSI
jgi:chromosome segregation ATPase